MLQTLSLHYTDALLERICKSSNILREVDRRGGDGLADLPYGISSGSRCKQVKICGERARGEVETA